MENTILAITLMPGHPDYPHGWIVDKNCEAIHFGIWDFLGKVCYQPIVDGEVKALYWAEQIETVYYLDGSLLSMEWTGKAIKGKIEGIVSQSPPPVYNCRCSVLPLSDIAWTCKCGSIRFLLLKSGEIECSGCHKLQKFKHTKQE